jgi:glycosyltransferase involved in cell wall biosynthesis
MLARAGAHARAYDFTWRRNAAVDARVARMVRAGDTVVAQYGAALSTFRRARECGATTVLDHPIAHHDTVRQILDEEARRRPDFRDTITGSAVARGEHLARIDDEIGASDVIVVGSTFAANSMPDAARPRAHVAPYGVDPTVFVPGDRAPRTGPLRVLFAGQLTQRKGIGYLLDAMRLVDPARVTLMLAGPAAGHGAGLAAYDGQFRHLGSVHPADMPRLYASADVLVLPSLVEGSALVVLEAMASGIPAIVTPNAGADALRDGVDGFVVPIRDPEAIAARLEMLSADDGLRLRLGTAARERALSFTWDAFAEEFRRALGARVQAVAA